MTTLHILTFLAGIFAIYIGISTIRNKAIQLGFGLPSIFTINLRSWSATLVGVAIIFSGLMFLIPLLALPFIGGEPSARLVPIIAAVAITSFIVGLVAGAIGSMLQSLHDQAENRKNHDD